MNKKETIKLLQNKIINIYRTYTDQIEFTDKDITELDRLEQKIVKLELK